MSIPMISVIIPTYNRCEMLRGALESLFRQETCEQFTYEVIVVDNASTDATREIVEKTAAESPAPIRYFYEPSPGPAPARNCGLTNAGGDWLAFFDDDELATSDWLLQLYRAALETRALIVGGAMHLDLPQETLNRLGHVVRVTSLREIDYYPTICPYTNKRLPGTNNALVAKQAFQAIGMFDATKKCGASDSDLFLRARAAGIIPYYTPHAVVRHRISPNRITPEYLRWDARQGCSAFAGLDCHFKGRAAVAALCVARIFHAGLVVAPRLVWAWVKHEPGEILGERVRLWRTEGYVRGTLANLAPSLFPQKQFFADLEFRRGRVVGQEMVRMEVAS